MLIKAGISPPPGETGTRSCSTSWSLSFLAELRAHGRERPTWRQGAGQQGENAGVGSGISLASLKTDGQQRWRAGLCFKLACLAASPLHLPESPPPPYPPQAQPDYCLRQGLWLKGDWGRCDILILWYSQSSWICLHESRGRCGDCIGMWPEIMALKHLRVKRSFCDLSSTPSSEVRNQAWSPGIQVL